MKTLRTKTTTATIIAATLLTGCAGNKLWVHPHKGPDAGQQDLAECKYDVAKTSNQVIPTAPCFGQYCGLSQGISTGISQGLADNRLTVQCMKVRGWKLIDNPNAQ